jgi:ribose 5-phosphate isomerase A
MKEVVGREIAKRVTNGEIIGVGTGTTVDAALLEIGRRVREEKLQVSVVPTSYQSAWKCQELGLQVLSPCYRGYLSWGFDGADQVNKQRWAIKGKGGALLQEKILAKRCRSFVIIVDESKVVERLGDGCAVPVEVIPEAIILAEDGLRKLGAIEISIRSGSGKHGPVVTERGNLILDATFPEVRSSLEEEVKTIVGVVDSGLFMSYASEVMVANTTGIYSF